MRLEINDKKINCKTHTHVDTKKYAIKQAGFKFTKIAAYLIPGWLITCETLFSVI